MSDDRWVIESRAGRFVAYGALGWCLEVAFTSLHDYIRYRDPRLPARSSLWMFPIYGLLAYLYEPLHDAVRERPWPVRGAAYGVGIMAIEYASGWTLRKAIGQAPWDYTYAKRHIHGLVRPAYFPYWGAVGLALERVHDRLTGR